MSLEKYFFNEKTDRLQYIAPLYLLCLSISSEPFKISVFFFHSWVREDARFKSEWNEEDVVIGVLCRGAADCQFKKKSEQSPKIAEFKGSVSRANLQARSQKLGREFW